jgi:hypothetical protein
VKNGDTALLDEDQTWGREKLEDVIGMNEWMN